MALPATVWSQLKNRTAKELIRALRRDGWTRETSRRSATLAFHKDEYGKARRRIVIHYHPKKTYGIKLLKSLVSDIGWTESDLKRLRLIR